MPPEVGFLDHDVAVVLAGVAQESDRVVIAAVTHASRAILFVGFTWNLKRSKATSEFSASCQNPLCKYDSFLATTIFLAKKVVSI